MNFFGDGFFFFCRFYNLFVPNSTWVISIFHKGNKLITFFFLRFSFLAFQVFLEIRMYNLFGL